MNTQAIHAGAVALYWEDGRAELGKWESLPYSKKTLYFHLAQTILEAARPYLESEIRAEIVEEIRSEALNDLAANVLSKSPRDLEQRQEIYYDLSIRIAEGKQ